MPVRPIPCAPGAMTASHNIRIRAYEFLMRLTRRLSERQLLIILAVIVGLVSGFAAYLFEELLHLIKTALVSWFPVDTAGYLFLVYPAIGIILASLFVRFIVKDNISEGVTRVLYAISKTSSRIKTHNCYTSMIGGAVTIGFGGSVGPEAPIVLTGSAIGSNIAQALRLNYRNTTLLLGCGAAGAIAAIFKAPITGLIFVLEILMLDISMRAIVPLLISSVVSTTLVLFLNGFDPMLNVNVSGTFNLQHLHMYVILAILCGLVSFYFTHVNGKIHERFSRIKKQSSKWIVGGVTLGIFIFLFPPLYGEGYSSFTDLMHGNIESLFNNSLFYPYRNIPWVVVLFLLCTLLIKVIAMAVTNAAGGIGGSFAPSLFVGAFTGGTLAYLCNNFLGMEMSVVNFSLVGMAGVMTGVMKAPLTSVFLIAELSNGYGLFVPLMLVASLSFAISYYLEPDSIYTKKLRAKGELITHNKDRSVMVFLNLDKLIETNFSPVNKDATLGDLVKIISSSKRNVFPVVKSDGQFAGIILLDDIRTDMFDPSKYGTPVSKYTTPPPDIIFQHEMISEVVDKFEGSKAWNLPVVDKNNKYLGFVSKSSILDAYRQQLIEITEE